MALTTLDPDTALIVVDLQKGILSLLAAHPMTEVIENAAALARAFRDHRLPVVLVTVAGRPAGRTEQAPGRPAPAPDFADLLVELDPQPEDHRVTKRTWGAFTGTDLETHMKGLGVTQVVLAGVATSAGVESTARQAHELGFNVTLAVDAMTDMSADAHANSLQRIFPKLGETGVTAKIITLLAEGRG